MDSPYAPSAHPLPPMPHCSRLICPHACSCSMFTHPLQLSPCGLQLCNDRGYPSRLFLSMPAFLPNSIHQRKLSRPKDLYRKVQLAFFKASKDTWQYP